MDDMNDKTEIKNSLVTKISKLLQLSKSCNEAEAQLAFQKASAMAEKYGLDLEMAAIMGQEVEKEPFAQEKIVEYTRTPVVHRWTVHLLQDFFKVRIIYNNRPRSKTMNFIGRKNDIEVAREVYDRLMKTFDYLWKNYKKEKGLSVKLKGSYVYGLSQGLREKLAATHQESIRRKIAELPEPIRGSSEGKLQLALVEERKLLEDKVGYYYPKLRKGGRDNYQINFRSNAYSDGVRDGRGINTGSTLSLKG